MASSAARAAPEGEAWRDALRSYLPDGDAPAQPQEETKPPTPLALQFELRELIPRTPSRWNGPVSKAAKATPGDLDDQYRLGVRPVARTSRGWARSGITWTNIPHLLNRLNLDPGQHRWFCEFGALHLALRPTTPGRDPDWIYLDDFANPVLWTLLDQTPTLGIQLVGSGTNATVSRAKTANLTLDATRDDSGIEIRPRLTIDKTRMDDTHARAISNHGFYLVDPATPRQILVAPTAETLTTDQLVILSESTRTRIPDYDADDFIVNYLPNLQERIAPSRSRKCHGLELSDQIRLPV